MQSFTIFTSSAMVDPLVDHINISSCFPQQHFKNDWVWLTIAPDIAHAQKRLMKI